MSSAIPTIPAAAPKPESVIAPRPQEYHHSASATANTTQTPDALSSTDVSYVESLMGAIPAQKMQEILLRTGIPMPANLGPNVDTAA